MASMEERNKTLVLEHSTHCSTNGIMRRPSNLYQPQACRLLALFGSAAPAIESPVSGVKRTSRLRVPTSEFDPKRSWLETADRRAHAAVVSES